MAKISKRVPLTKKCIGHTLSQDVILENSMTVLLGKNTLISQYAFKKLEERSIQEVHIWVDVKETERKEDVRKQKFALTHLSTTKKLENIFNDILNANQIPLEKVDQICSNIKVPPESKGFVFKFLSEIRSASDQTYTHSVNVSLLAGLLGSWLELSDSDIQQLMVSALMHDIGKGIVPHSILKKQDKLSNDELEEMKEHTTQGFKLLQKANFPEEIALAALYHHERIGGGGYPKGLRLKSDIPFFARIIAILDIFDAASHARVYRKGISSPFSIIKIFQEELFGQLDMDIVEVFVSNVIYMYLGETCRLSDNRLGEIVFINPAQIQSPMVLVGNQVIDLRLRRDLFISEVYMS